MDFTPHLRDCSPVDGCLDHLRDCPSVFPDEVMAYFMNLAGVDSAVPHVLRICGMATQKLVYDIGASALHYYSIRNKLSLDDPEAKFTLNLDDLQRAFEDYDDNLCVSKKPDYYI
uniref:Transcription initiation factor TFIID subunit 10 n=1 Tax=Lygus hesperus TaxID=30085 RepID=A0A0A9WDV2_LYGHE